jgi:hypothetical protein
MHGFGLNGKRSLKPCEDRISDKVISVDRAGIAVCWPNRNGANRKVFGAILGALLWGKFGVSKNLSI